MTTLVNGTVDSVTMGAGTDGTDLERRRTRQRAVQQRSADFELIHSGAHACLRFSIALSGLSAAKLGLDVTSNNIANANTVGFKNSQAEFADVYASGAVNLNTSTGGEGVRVVTAAQQFTQGNIITDVHARWTWRSTATASSR